MIKNISNPKDKKLNVAALIIGAVVVLIIGWSLIYFMPGFLVADNRSRFNAQTGAIGDTIGGVSGPFVGLIGAVLTFLAFYIQYEANNQQRDQFEQELAKQAGEILDKEKTWRIERFDSKFYELLRLHKDNVKEIKIGKGENAIENRRAFVSMFGELKYTFFCVVKQHDLWIKKNKSNKPYSDERLVRLAYIFFYCGVGDSSNIVSRAMNASKYLGFDSDLFEDVLIYLEGLKMMFINQSLRGNLPEFADKDRNSVTLMINYWPWGGHQSRLGHYYRHLYQTVKLVVSQETKWFDKKSKEEYLRSIRAQLSDYEQLMLYYNALANFGHSWIDKGYFTTFKMIHNIPIPLANFGISPDQKFRAEFKKDAKLFEWLE